MESGAESQKSHFGGLFYPSEKEGLLALIASFFAKTGKRSSGLIKTLIVPHAGYIYSGQTAAWAYQQLEKSYKNPHFVLIGPAHHYPFTGICANSCKEWQTVLGSIPHITNKNSDGQIFRDMKPYSGEHCLEVQLPFLQYLYGDNFSITSFLTGYQTDWQSFAQYLLTNYQESVFLISSDLSHYLPQNMAVAKDKKTISTILKGEREYLSEEENIACGLNGILTVIEIAKEKNWESKLFFYDTSASACGDKSAVVGYGAIGYY